MRTTRIQCYKKMKKKQTIWRVLAMMLVVAVCAGFAACGGGDDDDEPSAPTTTLSTSVNDLTFQSLKNDKQSVTIVTNSTWTISSLPDWLSASSRSGNETTTVTFTTLSDNKTATSKTGTITITAGTKVANISVTQSAGVMSGLEVKPTNIVLLSDAVAFTCEYGSNVSYFYRLVITPSVIELVSDDEILAYMESEGERLLRSEDYVLSTSGMEEGTKYAILTVGFDRNGNHGEVIRTDVTTKVRKNVEPMAYVTNMNHTSSRWTWDTQKNAVCNTYYMASTEDYDLAMSSDVYQAWLMNQSIKAGDIQQMLNDGSWYKTRTASINFVWTWGLDSSGGYAAQIYYNFDTYSSSAPKKDLTKPVGIKYEINPIPGPDKFKVYKMAN